MGISSIRSKYTPAGSNREIQINDNGVLGSSSGFVLNSSGNVGIGTDMPTAPLHLIAGTPSASADAFHISDGTYTNIAMYSGAADGEIRIGAAGQLRGRYAAQYAGTRTGHNFSLGTNDTTAITIDNSQRVGIGTTDPSFPLEVEAGSGVSGLMVGGTAGQVELQGDGQVYGYQKLDVASAGLQIKGYSDGGGAKTEQAKMFLTQETAGSAGGEIRFYTNDGSAVTERARIYKNGDIRFIGTATDAFYWDASSSRLGIGTASPDGTLHIHTGSAGSVTAHGSADDLVIEHASDAGLSILTPAANNGRIYFGSPTNNAYGQIDYDHATNDMVFATAGAGRLTLNASGNMGLNVTPSAWRSTERALQIDRRAALYADSHVTTALANNLFINSSGYALIEADAASQYIQYQGEHIWQTVGSGSAGANVSPSTLMTLTSAGNLSIDTDTLYVDAVNDRLGVNQALPTASLTVQAAHNSLHTMKIENAAGNVVQETYINGDGDGALNIRNAGGLHKMQFSTYEDSFINAGFNLGIGTNSPTTLLELNSSSGPEITIQRDDTLIAVDDLVGGIRFSSNDESIALGTPPHYGAGIKVKSQGTVGYQNMLLYAGQNNLGYENDTPSLRLVYNGDVNFYDNSGAVAMNWDAPTTSLGIRTASPNFPLQVMGEVFAGVMPGFEQSGKFYLGRGDGTGTDVRYHYIEANNSTTKASNYLSFNLHTGATTTSTSELFRLEAGPGSGAVKTVNIAFRGNSIENYTTATDTGNLWVNYEGYQGGTTYFRDFKVGNGKQSVIAFFDGSSGNVGIGTDVPDTSLHISGSGTIVGKTVSTNGSAVWQADSISTEASILYFTTAGSQAWKFQKAAVTGNLEIRNSTDLTKFTMLDNGNVGIGVTSPPSLLTLKDGNILLAHSSTDVDGGHGIFFHTTTNNWSEAAAHAAIYGKRVDGSNGYLRFDTRSGGTTAERMRLDSSGNLLIGYTSSNGSYKLQVNSQIFATNATIATSDGRYKEDVQTLSNATDLVSRLNPVQFKWKAHEIHNLDVGKTDVGFIAQEVQEVLSDTDYSDSVVVTNKTDDEEYLGLGETKLIPLLTAALQEAITKIETLETKVAALESV
jgi:hypothetical protein